jgi:predicted membrane metal-binding protein
LDIALGVVGAIVLIVATPGLAVSALIALLVLALCGLSLMVERRRRTRDRRSPRRSRAARGSPRRSGAGSERPRPARRL